jgi:hypothetical protein
MEYTREQALSRIRTFLAEQRKDDETTCQTAGRLGIFCKGYDKWTTHSLRDLYPWLAKKVPNDAPREELLKLVVAWDNARALVHNVPTTCDAHSLDHDACLGWDRFSNENLKRMFPQLFKPDDKIVQW